MSRTLRVLQVVPGTSVDGPGLRTSIYLAGCTHRCPECHNPDSWAADGGAPMTVEELMRQIRAHDFNVTLTGGDPLQHADLDAVRELAEAIVAEDYTLWLYTGYRFEDIPAAARPVVELCQAVVEGPYVAALRTLELPFRGSSNQRILRPDGSTFEL